MSLYSYISVNFRKLIFHMNFRNFLGTKSIYLLFPSATQSLFHATTYLSLDQALAATVQFHDSSPLLTYSTRAVSPAYSPAPTLAARALIVHQAWVWVLARARVENNETRFVYALDSLLDYVFHHVVSIKIINNLNQHIFPFRTSIN